jgi:hypothetical protein
MSDYRGVSLPVHFEPLDCTIAEAMAYRRESRWNVHQKIKRGVYEAYKDGRIRKIIFASVKADRERAMRAPPTDKRSPGRPRQTQPESLKPHSPPDRLAAENSAAGAKVKTGGQPLAMPEAEASAARSTSETVAAPTQLRQPRRPRPQRPPPTKTAAEHAE